MSDSLTWVPSRWVALHEAENVLELIKAKGVAVMAKSRRSRVVRDLS